MTNIRILDRLLRYIFANRGGISGVLIVIATIALEIFNFATTQFILIVILGDIASFGVRWATMLSLAVWALDFAGIMRLLSGGGDNRGFMQLFWAWLLANGANATTTWFSVWMQVRNHQSAGEMLVGHEFIIRVVPVFLALFVVLLRLAILTAFSKGGARLFTTGGK